MQLSFLHGFMGHPSDWDDIRSMLADHETFAPEVPKAPDWATTIRLLSESVPRGSILVGYSMGARLALGVSLEFPHRLGGLVFVSGNPGLEADEERVKRWAFDSRIAERIESESPERFLDDWYRLPVFSSIPLSIRNSERDRKLLRAGMSWAESLRVLSVAKQPDYWPRLPELTMPTLLVSGENDEKYRKISQRFSERATSTKLTRQLVPECGHIVHRERPAAFVSALRQFLSTFSHP
ncbi:MAG: alpha/beta fold hydrolase [Planctomycetota bacterium]